MTDKQDAREMVTTLGARFTQWQIAHELGVRERTVCRWIKGHSSPQARHRDAIRRWYRRLERVR